MELSVESGDLRPLLAFLFPLPSMSGTPRRRMTRRESAKSKQQAATTPSTSPSSSSTDAQQPIVLPSPRLLFFARIVVFSIVTIGFAVHHFKPWQRHSIRNDGGLADDQLAPLLRPFESDEYAICTSDALPSDPAMSDDFSSWIKQQTQRLFAPRATSSSIYTLRNTSSLTDPSPTSCILIRSNRIRAVGNYSTVVEPWCPSATHCDIRHLPPSHTLLPPFSDAHGHLLDLGHSLSSADLSGATSLNEVVQRLEAYVLERPWLMEKEESWLQAYGWDHTRWNDTEEGGGFPTMEDWAERSEVLRGRKIVAKRIDFHALWLSEAAVQAVAAASPNGELPQDVHGGLVVRDGNGKPTGILIDNAMQLAMDVMPPRSDEDRLRYLTAAEDLLLSYGITSVGDAAATLEDLAFYRRMDEEGKLRVKVYAFLACPQGKPCCDEEAKEALRVEKLPYNGKGDGGKLVVRTIKLFADGALGSWGSALWEPYSDRADGDRGLLLLNETDLRERITYWHDRGWQVAVHAIGDRANSLTLDAFEELAKRDGREQLASRRHRIEHAQLVRPEDQARFASLGIIASVQPTHCTSDMGYVAARIGEERARDRAYPWKSLLHPRGREGDEQQQHSPRTSRRAHLALGSDFPVESSDPILGLWSATQRLDLSTLSSPHGARTPWYGEERLTPLEALRGFTTEAAYAQFEDGGGRLEVGAKADFIVVKGDVLQDLTMQRVEEKRKKGAIEGNDRPKVVGTAIDGKWACTEEAGAIRR